MKRYLPFVIIAGVLIISTVTALLMYRSAKPETPPAANVSPTPSTAANFRHVRGEASAPVTLEEFGDFECPPCGALYPELKKIEEEYGSRLRVVFHHFPLISLHKNALQAAHAAEAAGVQGRFWEMHDKLYENQTTWSEARDLVPIFVDYAKQIGLNTDKFMKDLNGEQVAQRIFQDGKRSHSLGVNSTPTFYVNGKEAKDDQWKPEGLREMIRQALREAGK